MSAYPVEDRDSMSFRELVAWAWRETSPVHRNSTNLIIHLFAVPLFVSGHVLLLAPVGLTWRLAIPGSLCIVVSLALQACNFWRFLFSGQWYASLKNGPGHTQ